MNNPYSLVNKKIWVTGHKGMLGSSLLKQLGHPGMLVDEFFIFHTLLKQMQTNVITSAYKKKNIMIK